MADRVQGVVLDDGSRIEAPVVVNVAGPHSYKINALAGAEGDMRITTRALRQEVAHVPAPKGVDYAGLACVTSDSDAAIYTRPELGNNILIGSVKLVKSAAEIDCVRKSAAILDAAMETCRGSIAEGRTEREVSADVHHTLMVSGSDIPSSPMNFLTGPRTAYAHGEPTDRVLRPGDFMHIQFGAHYRRYCCTIGRQLCLGEPTTRMREVYQVARDAGDACMEAIRAGVPATVPLSVRRPGTGFGRRADGRKSGGSRASTPCKDRRLRVSTNSDQLQNGERGSC